MSQQAGHCRSVFLRLLWKEYRLQRALFVAILFGAVLLMGLLVSYAWLWPIDTAQMLWLMALGLPALYALGCGATSFAGEDDAGTFGFQRSLPVGAIGVLAAKAVFALFSLAILFGLVIAVAAAARWMAGIGDWLELSDMLISALTAVELLAWGMLFSMWTRRPLLSIVLGGLAAVCVGLVPWTIVEAVTQVTMDGYLAGLVVRSIALPIVVLLIHQSSRRWFLEQQAPLFRVATRPAWLSSDWGRLTWLAVRENRVLLVGSLVLAVLAAGSFFAAQIGRWWEPTLLGGVVLFGLMLICLLVPALLGVLVFGSSSQMRQMQFLVDRGVSGRKIWVCRHLVYGIAAVLYSAVLLTGWGLTMYSERPGAGWGPVLAELSPFMFGFFLSFAAAQWCSFFIQRKLAAFFLGAVISAGFGIWIALMLAFEVPALVAFVPWGLILLAHTWIRAPWWLARPTTVRNVLGNGAAITLCGAAALTGVMAYRAFEIPATEMSPELLSSPPALPDAEIERAQKLYGAVLNQLVHLEMTWEKADAVFDAFAQGVDLASFVDALDAAHLRSSASSSPHPPTPAAMDRLPTQRRSNRIVVSVRDEVFMEFNRAAPDDAAGHQLVDDDGELRDKVQAVAEWYQANEAVAVELAELTQQQLTIGWVPLREYETLRLASAGALIDGDLQGAVTFQLTVLRLAEQVRRGMAHGNSADWLEIGTYTSLRQLAATLEPTSPLRDRMRDAIADRYASLPYRIDELRRTYHQSLDLLQRLPDDPAEYRLSYIDSNFRNFLWWMPWERVRCRRLIDHMVQVEYELLIAVRDELPAPTELPELPDKPLRNLRDLLDAEGMVELYSAKKLEQRIAAHATKSRLDAWDRTTFAVMPTIAHGRIEWRMGQLREATRQALQSSDPQ